MIGIVLVSHSQKLAEGVHELVNQMVQDTVPIAVAGGIDNPDNPIGTDPMKVLTAIESVYSPEGVLVLMDLGSALMSAEAAIDFLPPEQQANIYLCEAPLVEGAMGAAVQAMIGQDMAKVLEETRGVMEAKTEQLRPVLNGHIPAQTAAPVSEQPGDALSLTLTVPNKQGLHARPIARLVQIAGSFEADLTVQKDEKQAGLKNMGKLMTLIAKKGDELTFRATGPDAADALEAIQALANDNFGDDDSAPEEDALPKLEPVSGADISGVAASPGVAIGPVAVYTTAAPHVETVFKEDGKAEWKRLEKAIEETRDALTEVADATRKKLGKAQAEIIEAQKFILQDTDLLELAHKEINDNQINAEAAWQTAVEWLAASYENLPDLRQRERAIDVRDAGQRVLFNLMGLSPGDITLQQPSVLAAEDLTPSVTARLDTSMVIGIITAQGGATSHSAILARAMGVPAVVGIGDAFEQIEEGQEAALDGMNGLVWIKPSKKTRTKLEEQSEIWQSIQEEARKRSLEQAATQDGKRIEVAANIANPSQAADSLTYGAEGVGLFRTEFLFMERDSAPTEDEQYKAYATAAANLEGRPLIIRTLDIGGDKPIPYIDIPPEENPFLGWRGLRYCLDTPDLFKTQLRAILRASADHDIRIMFPMVSTPTEVQRAKQMLTEVRAELDSEKKQYNPDMQVGIMVEVPAAVFNADALAYEVDFFSIGTNDLTQYVMAADRGNPKVKNLQDALQPAVLRAIKRIADAAHNAGIWIGMCGELAGNVDAVPLLVGLGLDELSMSATSIPLVKEKIRGLTLADAQDLAAGALTLESTSAVYDLLARVI